MLITTLENPQDEGSYDYWLLQQSLEQNRKDKKAIRKRLKEKRSGNR